MEDLLKSLIDIQQRLDAPKGQYNSFGKYNYRSLEDIEAAIKPLLREHQCGIRFSDQVVEHCGRTFLQTTVYFFNTKGENISVTAEAEHSATKTGMDAAQITGSCSTYARKHALCGLLAVDDGSKDPDARKNIDMITKSQVKIIVSLAEKKGSDLSEICDYFKVGRLEEMTAEEYAKCIRMLEAKNG
jgi:hypothetical protein